MSEVKTKQNNASVNGFLNSISPIEKKSDGFKLLEIFERITGEKGMMWGISIVGFGKYHYKSEKSSQEADWMLVGFSPRKQNLSIYVMAGNHENKELFDRLGKCKTSVGCLYVNKLVDINLSVLEKLIENSYNYMKKNHIGC